MESSPNSVFTSPPGAVTASAQSTPASERAYRGLTIAAVLLILASLLLI